MYVSHRLGRGSGELLASGFVLHPVHFVERHGLLLIVAFGESVIAIGIGLGEVDLDARTYFAAVLGLVLVSTLWWTYFAGDDERALEALRTAPTDRLLGMASNAFFFAFLPMLLGIVTLAAGVALTIGGIDTRAAIEPAALLGGGAALYLAGDVLFRWALGVQPIRSRIVGVAVLLATIAAGVAVSGLAQLLAIIATLVLVLVVEQRARLRDGPYSRSIA
jgi:low temperature requirement protein LtrA